MQRYGFMATDVMTIAAPARVGGLHFGDTGFAWLMIAPAMILMLVFYVYPIIQVLAISVAEPKPGLSNYTELVESGSIQRVLLTTARICAITTALSVFLGYVVAYAMAAGSTSVQRWTLIAVVLPMWISALVRAFAWVVLLRREGVINSVLQTIGITDHPLALVWNEIGVVIGMVHYMLPYAILPLYANMRDIDRRYITAARGLGASRTQAFRRIFLPLSLSGIVAASALVLVYSLGFFVIPAILGGGKTLMVAEYVRLQISELLNWGRGTMLAVTLLVTVFTLLGSVTWLLGAKRLFGGGNHG
jgi:putative spermidine/putrescine transport system permease protein